MLDAMPDARDLTGRLVGSRRTVAVAALAAFALRLLGLTRPVRADEAGFELVARSWHPSSHSVYGAYFVDKPPPLIALFKVADAVGGPLFIRVVGAVACGGAGPRRPRRRPGWSSTSTARAGPRSQPPRS